MPYRGFRPANVSGAGIVFGLFAALVTHIMLNLLSLGFGLTAADAAGANAADDAAWTAFAVWTIAGIISAFVGGAVAGWMAGAVAGSPGFHGLVTWAITTVVVVGGASFLAATSSALAGLAGPSFIRPSDEDLSAAELGAAADLAGSMALASFVALAIGASAAYMGAQMAAHRETRLHPHTEYRA